ncbi:MAG: DUF1501 domain-containing protein [Candidatus Melainabacteria bacterium]|nr:DUF1501 domain-containing protein [Candidatus Melainabacteria bacterium]
MKRRDFLRASALASLSAIYPGLHPGISGWAYSSGKDSPGSKKLVVIFLRGAADGLNVVIPYGDPAYYNARPTIAVARPGETDGALDLDGHFGLHPQLEPLMKYWQDGSLAFVHCSGSPDPTRSHFDAQDYMESGCPGRKVVSSGWLNRLLTVLPSTRSSIRAINVGSTMPRILQGPVSVASFAPARAGRPSVADRPFISAAFEKMYAARDDSLGVAFREGMESHRTLKSKFDQEMTAANKGAPQAANFKGFGSQLGKLFGEDRTTQVAFVALGGWDTHVNQGAGKGQLANHLGVLGKGLADLARGLGPQYRDTVILVISEFGRTVNENGNGGTDHGHGNVMFVMGGGIRGGKVYGQWQGLDRGKLFEGRDLPVTTDFRSVIGQAAHEHMSIATADLGKILPDFQLTDRSMSAIFGA